MDEKQAYSSAEQGALTYAWNWFAMHSNQRMQLVYFWLLAVAFMTAALVNAISSDDRPLAFAISTGGITATVGFHRLDVRTRQLITAAEAALEALESRIVSRLMITELAIVAVAKQRSRFSSYRDVIRFLHFTALLGFAASAAYSLV